MLNSSNKKIDMRKRLVLIIVIIGILGSKAEQRFFPANGIRCINAEIYSYIENEQGMVPISPDTVFYERWTGNDTIVDGKQCVSVWGRKCGRDLSEYTYIKQVGLPNTPMLHGFIYEDEGGYVYYSTRDSIAEWCFLYDFSNPDWEVGDTLRIDNDMFFGDEHDWKYSRQIITKVYSYVLCNGESVSVANALMYGIGYNNYPFLAPISEGTGYSPIPIPVKFYREGVLLWDKFRVSETMIPFLEEETSDTPYYDLMGRKVDSPTRGIYIKDGRKVVIK
jgi:hypothetical protein